MESTPHQPCVLAIDIGGQGCRAAIFTTIGKKLFITEANYPTHSPQPGFVEQPIATLLEAVDTCLKHVTEYLQLKVNLTLASSGLACQGSNLLCWHAKTGLPLTDVISWQDTRGKDLLADKELDNAKCRNITGLNHSPHYGASKYQWCITQLDSVKTAKADNYLTLGPLASYLAQYITRPKQPQSNRINFIDPSHATRTYLWDLRNRCWSKALLDSFEISASMLPAPSNHYHDYGTINGVGVPLQVINRDQSAALFSQGKPDKKITYINMGTGVFIQRILSKLPETLTTSLQVSPLLFKQNESSYTAEGSVHCGMNVKAQIEQRFDIQVTPEAIEKALSQLFKKPVNQTKSQTSEFSLVTEAGLGSPFWRDDVESIIPAHYSFDKILAAWMQSLLFLTQINIDLLDKVASQSEEIAVSGGLSRYDELCQHLADLSQRPVIRYQDPHATLRGTAYLATDCPQIWEDTGSQRDNVFSPSLESPIKACYRHWCAELSMHLKHLPDKTAQKITRIKQPPPIFVGHRGDIHQHPENTIAAIIASLEGGLQQVEFDIQIAKGGMPVLLHDPDLQRIHHHDVSIFDTDYSKTPLELETLWALIDALAPYPDSHCYIEIKHDSIDHWGIDFVLSTIKPLLKASINYTLLARSLPFLQRARQRGHLSVGANVRNYSDRDKQQLEKLSPDYLVINQERIPQASKLWPGDWQWMVYEVTNNTQAQQLRHQGASHMISFNANQLHQYWDALHA